MSDEQTAVLRNVRERGRIGGIPGVGYLEPGQEHTLPLDVATKLADPTIGLVIIATAPAKSDDKFKAKPRKQQQAKVRPTPEPDTESEDE